MSKFLKQKNRGREISSSLRLSESNDLSLSKGFTRTPRFGVTPKGGGFTLVETLVAISIFTVSLLGIMSVLASSIADTSYAKQKMTATYLAQEGIEYMRYVRDSDVLFQSSWSAFESLLSKCTSSDKCGFAKAQNILPYSILNCNATLHFPQGCELLIDSNGLYDSNPDPRLTSTDSGFKREIWMKTINSDEVEIYSEVSWTQGSGPQSVTFSENLFNWIE